MFLFSDIVDIQCTGFGIDSSGIIYLGFGERIMKYNMDGERIGTIPIRYRGYRFEILKDDTILCSDGKNTHILDLNGNELEIINKTGSKEYDRSEREKKTFTANDGQEYVMRMPFGRRIIKSKDGEVIWKTPLKDYLIFLIGLLSLTVLMGCNVILIFRTRTDPDWEL